MFVIPPPPRYPPGSAYGMGMGGFASIIETNNVLHHPTGPEWQFLVGEGTYVLKEDLYMATPPPHPSEAPIVNPNPLATNPQPATAGTKLSLLRLDSKPSPFLYKGPSANALSLGTHLSIQEHPKEDRYSTEGGLSSDEERAASSDAPASPIMLGSAPAFGEGNSLLMPTPSKDVHKKKKPKNSVMKSNSSFISRVIVTDNLSKKLAERSSSGLYIFANINRAYQWLDMSSPNKQEYYTKILFTKAHALCHDVNSVTKSHTHVDVIIGFSTGEIIWWEPMSQRYTRLNKNGIINNTPVSEIRWIPGSENLFLAAHMDGLLVVYDKEKEDGALHPEEEGLVFGQSGSEEGDLADKSNRGNHIQINKSVHSKNQKTNPVAVWKLSNQRINAFAFSPDNRRMAVVSEDGTLRVIDYLREKLLALFYSYYGGLSCVCWSPDGKYILTGGQDDLISIWSIAESALVARCQGHDSWVSAVAFDPWRCDDRNYRFGSVAEDGHLCLWDFNVGMLHRPKTAGATRHRASIASRITAPQRSDTAGGGNASLWESPSSDEEGLQDLLTHPVEPRAVIPMLPPVLTHVIDTHPASWLEFTEDAIITSCKSGHIRTWNRPGTQSTAESETAA